MPHAAVAILLDHGRKVMAKSPLLMDLRPGKGQQVLPAIPRGLFLHPINMIDQGM